MKIADIIQQVDLKKPNSYPQDIKLGYINFIDSNLAKTVQNRNDFVPYTTTTQEVIAPGEFVDLYEYYLMGMIDLLNQEFTTYNNYISLYNNAYTRYMAYYINSVPKSIATKITGLG